MNVKETFNTHSGIPLEILTDDFARPWDCDEITIKKIFNELSISESDRDALTTIAQIIALVED